MNIESISISRKSTVRAALAAIEKSAIGIVLLVDDDGRFERTVTDGDLRRLLLDGIDMQDSIASLPRINSIVASPGIARVEALGMMNERVINHLPVVDGQGRVIDILLRKDIDQQILLSTPHIGTSEMDYVQEAFRTNWIAPLGPNVDAFEKELAELVGSGHAAALSSGTAAIHLGLRLLDVGPGDKVFCSTLTFIASANPVLYQGAEPVFIDSEPSSWNMSPEALQQAFDAARSEGWMPKAVIVVNLYGQSADMDRLLAICNENGVPVLEDAAESLGALYKGRHSGTFGKLGVYSFNGNKIITTSGGGMLVSDDKELIAAARFLATQARDPAPHYQHSQVGYNYRMSNILAGVGRGQLQVLQQRVDARRAVFDAYRNGLADLPALQWMPEPDWSYSTHWLTAATLADDAGVDSQQLIHHLAQEMIEARPVWKPMHLQPVFAACRYFAHPQGAVSDRLFERGICLPSGSNMSTEQVERIVRTIRAILG